MTSTGLVVPRGAELLDFPQNPVLGCGCFQLGWALVALSALVLSQDRVWVLGETLESTGLHIHGDPCRDDSRAGLRGRW